MYGGVFVPPVGKNKSCKELKSYVGDTDIPNY